MRLKLSPALIKSALASHSWFGLLVGGLMYVICLSGALLVFHSELEQWEQAFAPEVRQLDIQGAQRTFNDFVRRGEGLTPHLYLVLPSADSPHARIATEHESWFLNADGSLGPREDNAWSTLLLNLHYYLHLPESWGMILVSVLGAVLVGLIASGFLAHPGLFRDAFRLRQAGSQQIAQTDLHNRLSVWAAPFHLMIAVTGAYFGLALPTLALVADAEFGGDRDQVVQLAFGEEPKLASQEGPFNIAGPLEEVARMAPDAPAFLVVVHDAGMAKQHLSVSARHPGRLIYAESYLFTTDGAFLGTEGRLDSNLGKLALYSIYRLHFGNFAGTFVKLLYLAFGLALAAVAASGVNIWLAKRRKDDGLSDLWVGIVWGTPLALAVSAVASFYADLPLTWVMWAVVAAACAVSLAVGDRAASKRILRLALVAATLLLVICHAGTFGSAAYSGAPGGVNLGLIAFTAIGCAAEFWPGVQRAATRRRPAGLGR